MSEQPGNAWWQDYFSRHYATLYRGPLAEELATEDEVALLARLFAGAAGPVLDLGCGFGRHMAPLRQQRVPVVGLDYSAPLLNAMPRVARRHAVRGDLRSLPFDEASCAGAYMLFNTFGYFDDVENQRVLKQVARVLSPGARFLLDIPARSGMVHAAREQPACVKAQGRYTIAESWAFDAASKRLAASGSWQIGNEAQSWRMSIRLYTPTEITRLLKGAGFSQIEIRPSEQLAELATGAPELSASSWRSVTNMAVLAQR